MEKDIQKSLSNYYNILRDYQYELQNKINEITQKIQSTIETSLLVDNLNNYSIILENNKEHKLISLIERIFDIFKNKKLEINIDPLLKQGEVNSNDNNKFNASNIDIINNNIVIIKVKIQLKKIIVNLIESDILIVLNINKNKENKNNLEIINNYISSL
jgi:hypothetical protein